MMGNKGQNEVKKMELELLSMLSLLEEYKNTLERKEDVSNNDAAVSIAYIYMLEKEILGLLLKYSLIIDGNKENFKNLVQNKFKLGIEFDTIDSSLAMGKVKADLDKLNSLYADKPDEKNDDVF